MDLEYSYPCKSRDLWLKDIFMKIFFVFFIVLLLISVLQGITIEVDIGGNGDYTSVQEGIDAASDGDIVLIYPGRYIENIDYIGKTIIVTSLEMTTGNRDYIHSTIIDGNQISCCVYVNNDEDEGTTLRGLTLTNGSGHVITVSGRGGGIYTRDANLAVINCFIENNNARTGGGILVSGTELYLEGCTIRNNHALEHGGGLSCGRLNNSIEFSSENRCNIYTNFAPIGQDIYNSVHETAGTVTDVIVDTFSVAEPWGYEFYQGDSSGNQNYEDMTFDMLQAKYEKMEVDLYVAPWGNNENSGLSEQEALYSINKALQLISADSEHPRTIYLSNGVYAPWNEEQTFPLVMRSYVSLTGESEENTIIDLQNAYCGFFIDKFGELGYEIKNMTIQNGYLPEDGAPFAGLMSYIANHFNSSNPLVFENIAFNDNDYLMNLVVCDANITIKNAKFFGNHCENGNQKSYTIRSQVSYNNPRLTLIENCIFQNNYSGVVYFPNSSSISQGYSTCNVVNCLFTQNEFENEHTPYFPEGISIVASGAMDLNIINCTFADNNLYGPTIGSAPVYAASGVYAELANNIFYGNTTTHSIIAHTDGYAFPVVVVHHNIIENGIDGVLDEGNFVIWDDNTNWDEYPFFYGAGDHPYSLLEDSPAIDMGTLNLPECITLPEYDLAGNPRIMGNGIDLGAYEWQGTGIFQEEIVQSPDEITIYPNPFNPSTTISFSTPEGTEHTEIIICNVKGQRIRELKIDPASYTYNRTRNVKCKMNSVVWDGKDDKGDSVSSGIYFIRLKIDNDIHTNKVMMLR